MEVIAGSYEGAIVGYAVGPTALESGSTVAQLRASQPIFAEVAHDGCVRAVACGGPYLATGGSDNTISVYNLRKRRNHGKLLQQEGGAALYCLAFYSDSHLLSGDGDGELCIWRTSDWECLLRMKGHKGAVLDIAIHPSGRAALSVGADKKMMLWNLTTGKCNYTSALQAEASAVLWSPSGDEYLLVCREALQLLQLRTTTLLHSFRHSDAPALCAAFARGGLLLSGAEDATVRLWDTSAGTCVRTLPGAHAKRVKAISVVDGGKRHSTVVTASTDGSVKLWRLDTKARTGERQPQARTHPLPWRELTHCRGGKSPTAPMGRH